jgi:signal recognition particle subunit SRP54
VFDALKKGFREAQFRLAGLAELDEQNIKAPLAEVRTALLEADVELGVVKRFLARVEQKALGTTVQTRVKHKGARHYVGAAEQFIKICNDELVAMMDSDRESMEFAPEGQRTRIMMVGLQGSGKTTTSAKLARKLLQLGKKPMLVACDMQRPAAVEQLKVLAAQVGVPLFNLPGESPLSIARAADAAAKQAGCDVVIYDTAGRLAIDEPLMQELGDIKAAITPQNIYFVVDAMIGQDAVATASGFNERLSITGVILTKLDGDARGGAALSVKEVTGAPIVFTGVGETTDKLEEFRADGMAGRILGMGDVVGLIEDFRNVVDEKKAEEEAARIMSGDFSLEDFLGQIRTIQQMGSLTDLVEKMPGVSGMIPAGTNLDDRELVRIEAMIQSMTRVERRDPNLMIREPGRAQRVARGSGQKPIAVQELVQKFSFMKQMMSFGDTGMLGKLPGMKQFAAARNMRRAMKSGKLPPGMGMPGMPGMGMPGMGMPGMGMPGMPGMGMPADEGVGVPRMRQLSRAEKNSRKSQRKQQRSARKKGRK